MSGHDLSTVASSHDRTSHHDLAGRAPMFGAKTDRVTNDRKGPDGTSSLVKHAADA